MHIDHTNGNMRKEKRKIFTIYFFMMIYVAVQFIVGTIIIYNKPNAYESWKPFMVAHVFLFNLFYFIWQLDRHDNGPDQGFT